MAKRDIGQEILDGLCEIKAHKAGQVNLRKRILHPPPSASEVRAKLQLSPTAVTDTTAPEAQTTQHRDHPAPAIPGGSPPPPPARH